MGCLLVDLFLARHFPIKVVALGLLQHPGNGLAPFR
jgi:hypothetical protein